MEEGRKETISYIQNVTYANLVYNMYINYRAELTQQFPGVVDSSASDVEEAIYSRSRSEVGVS